MSPSSSDDSAPKKKRTRTLTTPHQSAVLHALLAKSRFPTTAMREEVGRQIGLSARKVQIWFQNQRQKARRPQSDSPLSRPPQFGPFPAAGPSSSTDPVLSGPGMSNWSPEEPPSTPTSPHLLPPITLPGPSLPPPRSFVNSLDSAAIPPPFVLQPQPQWDPTTFTPYTRPQFASWLQSPGTSISTIAAHDRPDRYTFPSLGEPPHHIIPPPPSRNQCFSTPAPSSSFRASLSGNHHARSDDEAAEEE